MVEQYKIQGVSTHSRLKAAGRLSMWTLRQLSVSTHSRLKAAGFFHFHPPYLIQRFNTQPPEGGWLSIDMQNAISADVSTHSRLKAAGSK